MRSLKPASSNNGASRRLTLLHLVCAAALFSFLVFVIQSSFFAGSSFFNSLCFPLPFISIIIFSHLFFSFLVPNFRLSPASCRSQQGRGPDFVGFPVQRSAMRGLYIMLTFTLIAFISCSSFLLDDGEEFSSCDNFKCSWFLNQVDLLISMRGIMIPFVSTSNASLYFDDC